MRDLDVVFAWCCRHTGRSGPFRRISSCRLDVVKVFLLLIFLFPFIDARQYEVAVTSVAELEDALRDGEEHIVVASHIDARGRPITFPVSDETSTLRVSIIGR